ncbi:MAG: hypothetical protein JSR46_03520 [Verrucomicrobia bacterium]|nr:hypothetical protein [Verrucomicrobiota bacterium]
MNTDTYPLTIDTFEAYRTISDHALFKALSKKQELCTINLRHCYQISAETFMCLPFARTAKQIDVSYTTITNDGLHNIFTRCPYLERLYVIGCKSISTAGFLTWSLPLTLRYVCFHETSITTEQMNHVFYAVQSSKERSCVNWWFFNYPLFPTYAGLPLG